MKTKLLLLALLSLIPGLAKADDYYIVGLQGVDMSLTPTTPLHELGVPYFGKQGVFEYGKAEGAVTAGNWVTIDENNDVVEVTTTTIGDTPKKLGCAVATAADEDYVWVWRGAGTFECILANGVTANTQLTTTATAGDAGTGGDTINSCRNIDAGVTDTRVTVYCGALAYGGAA